LLTITLDSTTKQGEMIIFYCNNFECGASEAEISLLRQRVVSGNGQVFLVSHASHVKHITFISNQKKIRVKINPPYRPYTQGSQLFFFVCFSLFPKKRTHDRRLPLKLFVDMVPGSSAGVNYSHDAWTTQAALHVDLFTFGLQSVGKPPMMCGCLLCN